MAMSVQYRQQEAGSLGRGGMMVMEKDDDLSLFLEMRDSDMEKNNLSLVRSSHQFDDLELKPESSLISETTPMINGSGTQVDDLLSIENKNDYEWLLAPPENLLIPSLEKKTGESATSQTMKTNARATTQQLKLSTAASKPASGTNKSSTRSLTSNAGDRRPSPSCSSTSNAGIRRPSPSRGPTSTSSRSTTPAGRPTLPLTTKPSRPSTPTSRATSASITKPSAPIKRSSTPTISSSHSSTPTARPSALTTSKSTSRSSTPTHRPSATSGPINRSSSVTKSNPTASKNPVPSRGNSPAVKSRPSLPEKPASESRGRPTLPIVKVSSTEMNYNRRIRRNSISPSRGKLSNGIGKARGNSDINDDVNPVLMGTKMVERVVNMRKLAPPMQDDPNSASGKSPSFQENSGFGRSLSKKSFDMALRHMDIRRSMPGNLRAMITKVPASSMYSVRSDSIKSKTVSASDSPDATSSSASSELSLSNNSYGSTEVGDNEFRSSE